ncbi:glycoside hydrolase family 61 protein [Tulasnella calospora MUT 4182]|uniref:Glycoside hydrolase family 61 protein n=1 Tax=Tulasnella calospora MUT 4182 TaxID=1051891 RepID=A0A0C3QH05_9AGAM|nr:glycoside hydrolase family 61 protein [Tulasnella calospora MUT 4182]
MASTPGKCAIRGSCGSKGRFGPQLPCPYDGPPQEVEDDSFKSLLTSVCGPELANSPVCCTAEQVQTLQSNFQQAETIISSCPACRNNFREFYCKFTCSPSQGEFISVTSTQKTSTGQTAVKSLDFRVSEQMGQGFFDSCKNVKFSATNGYAMDFIGGGAKNYSAFLQYMGDERPGLGSPFQINFPAPSHKPALDYRARDCSDSDLGSRCACIDCPSVCAVLPPIEAPSTGPHCQIGAISCLSFFIIVAYALAVTSFVTGFGIMAWRRKRKTSERAPLLDTNSINGVAAVDPANRTSLVGASSLAGRDADQSSGAPSDTRGLGRGLQNLINPFESSPPPDRLNTRIRRFFYRLGSLCASYPWLTLAAASVFVAVLNLGWTRFAVEVDPVRLWVPPTSETKLQKEYFDEHFGPFYRTEQIFISRAPPSDGLVAKGAGDDPVLSWDVLRWWMDVEEEIRNLRSPNGYTLNDVCFKPAGPRGACVVQSIGAWFGNDLGGWDPDTWQDQVLTCASNPSACLPDYGQPLGPKYVLGGTPESQSPRRWLDAKAMVVTYVVSDSNDLAERAKAEEWERELKSYLERVASSAQAEENVQLAYSTGVSLEEEINQSTNTDVRIVVLSYLVMFLYISLTLGGGSSVPDPDEKNVSILLRKWVGRLSGVVVNQETEPQSSSFSLRTLSRRTLVQSKFMLGLFGIILVIVSVSTSVGLFSFLGVKVTLIIAEVIPFLVLAVGVDNVFILVHELDRQNSLHGPNAPLHINEAGGAPISPASYRSPFESQDSGDVESTTRNPLPAEERVARAVAKMGPSILLSSLTETIAFALGALVPMPAVRNFALYAAGSVFLGAILQVTAFVAALTIDLRREEDNRVDCLPCIKIPQRIVLPTSHASPRPGVLTRFMQKYYAPFLLKDSVKSVVVAAFAGLFAASVISIQHIKLGLDQRLALPSTSYLVPYFDAVDKYLEIGPPVYFVSTENDVTARVGQQNICGRFTTCDDFSLINTLEGERNRPESSFIAEPPAGWFDDFFRWLDPQIESCCRVRKADPSVFCSARTPARLCKPCFEGRRPEWNITLSGMPEGDEFMRYLRQWLVSPTDDDCPLGGMAAYGSALALTDSAVEASHFRTFHTPLKSQDDFINAFASANRIASDISERTGTKVFPYSLFYVFFEQYIYIINITQEILGLGLAAVLTVTSVLLGSWRTGTIVTGVVGLTVVNVMGVMGIWGISLNALSLVNLVISLGIAVEFCSHIARAFMSAGPGLPADDGDSPKERNGRVWTALADVGPSVLSGITFTKLIGMSVLALTRSKLLEIYYFRMWLTLIISGALHGLVLLPVVLSLAGGPGFRDVDEDEEWMANAIRSADQEYA